MEAVPANERIHRVKTSVAEKSRPQVEITNIAIRGVQFAAGFFPQTPAPKRRLLLNVFVGAGQEAVTRPAG
jgi:hypothetical protein